VNRPVDLAVPVAADRREELAVGHADRLHELTRE
jgi:hypothetical protein